MAESKLPPYATVIKNRDVEDPVNVWLHRPLAYAFVALVYRTPLTPNQVTLIAILFGLAAGSLWVVGSPTLMLVGGVLLWTSSILDGADGILARAKHMQSELGRALDGTADMIVAIATVIPAFYHIWIKDQNPLHIPLMVVALLTAVAQIYLYDFYKETYLASLNPDWDGRTITRAGVEDRLEKARAEGASWIVRFAWSSYVGMLTAQNLMRRITDPRGGREGMRFTVNEETTKIHRRHNYWPMQLWALDSLCPHTYIMAISGMLDRLDLYLWYRVVVGNLIFVTAIVWQRIGTDRTMRELEERGMAPVAEGNPSQTTAQPC